MVLAKTVNGRWRTYVGTAAEVTTGLEADKVTELGIRGITCDSTGVTLIVLVRN